MPQFAFSPEFKAKMRELVMPISVRVIREVADSPEIVIEELRCLSCGFVYVYNPPKVTKATAVHDCEWTHEFSWKTGERCGGQFAFVTQPIEIEGATDDEETSSLLRLPAAGPGDTGSLPR